MISCLGLDPNPHPVTGSPGVYSQSLGPNEEPAGSHWRGWLPTTAPALAPSDLGRVSAARVKAPGASGDWRQPGAPEGERRPSRPPAALGLYLALAKYERRGAGGGVLPSGGPARVRSLETHSGQLPVRHAADRVPGEVDDYGALALPFPGGGPGAGQRQERQEEEEGRGRDSHGC